MKHRMKASWILLVLLGTGLLIAVAPPLKSASQATVGAGNYCSLNGKLVWTSNRDGNYDIYRMDEDGTNVVQLTNDEFPTINQHPVFTPDCEEIVWSRSGDLWRMRTDGSNQTQLTFPAVGGEDNHPWVAADGTIYFIREVETLGGGTAHTIWKKGPGGSEAQILGPGQPKYHPNVLGALMLHTVGRPGTEIHVYDLNTGQDQIVYRPGWAVSGATWSPNSQEFIVAEDKNGNGNYRLVAVGYPIPTSRVVVQEATASYTIPYFAHPSGAFVDAVRLDRTTNNWEIFRMNPDGTRVNLTNHPAVDTKIVTDDVKEMERLMVQRLRAFLPPPLKDQPLEVILEEIGPELPGLLRVIREKEPLVGVPASCNPNPPSLI